jgi:uncharacterized membrane protein
VANILIAGESWMMHTIHVKGFDSFTTSAYEEGVGWLRSALVGAGHAVRFMPNHEASTAFPTSAEALREYDVVILSDIGANTLLLHPQTFGVSKSLPNRLALVRDFVAQGGALVMIGGYLTFQGIDGKGRYAGTPIEDALPVTLSPYDDRVEAPQGARPRLLQAAHPIARGLPAEWPQLLGYNRVRPKDGANVIATVDDDPLIVAWSFGKGRSLAFTSDCGPHWAPPDFVNWEGYVRFWANAADWLTSQDDR